MNRRCEAVIQARLKQSDKRLIGPARLTEVRRLLRALCALAMTTVVLLGSHPLAAQESAVDLREIERKLTALEAKVNQLNAVHEQMISKQAQVKEELESLKIWIRRHRG